MWSLLGGTSKYALQQWSGSRLVWVEWSPVPVHGVTMIEVEFRGHTVSIDFIVVDGLKVVYNWSKPFGETWMYHQLARQFSIPLHNTINGISSDCRAKTASVSWKLTIPPYSELETVVGVDITEGYRWWRVCILTCLSWLQLGLSVLFKGNNQVAFP